jgi:hypothetical protein
VRAEGTHAHPDLSAFAVFDASRKSIAKLVEVVPKDVADDGAKLLVADVFNLANLVEGQLLPLCGA